MSRAARKASSSLPAITRASTTAVPAAVTGAEPLPCFLSYHNKHRGWAIAVRAKPTGKRSRVVDLSLEAPAVDVEIAAKPQNGEANAELLDYLAEVLCVRKKELSLVSGDRSKDKVVLVAESAGKDPQSIVSLLREHIS